ncbi:hypothetical protein [Ensifer sp. ENS08]|uniref:hypothetical protein n=1 Tax=Ensifer sp. ENS08 TaxID=2769273 RepID=UPI001783908A|nr:hypothetical protein [Ensifer sp. ENS08]MBD9569025.1 hypothetical protein [Ensifer sp. ENS08]
MATAATVFRDYETDGVPSSGAKKPKKSEIRQLLGGYEAIINAFLSNGGLIFASKASLDASLNYAANTMAWVLGDATVANNGIYRKIGGSGTGSWTRVSDLPFSFIIASDAGAGTANAIQATTSIPVLSSALVWTNIFEANTASPVTISFNGGSALTIKTNTGNNVAAGGLVAGMIVLGIVSGSTFRLFNDQVSSAIVAAAEAAQAAAEAAQAAAEDAAADAVSLIGLAATALQPGAESQNIDYTDDRTNAASVKFYYVNRLRGAMPEYFTQGLGVTPEQIGTPASTIAQDTAAMQRAIDADDKVLFGAKKKYKISQVTARDSQTWEGSDSLGLSCIEVSHATNDIVIVEGSDINLRRILFTKAAGLARSGGHVVRFGPAEGNAPAGSYHRLSECAFFELLDPIVVNTNNRCDIDLVKLYSCTGALITVVGGFNHQIRNPYSLNDPGLQPTYGVYIKEVGDIQLNSAQLLRAGTCVFLDVANGKVVASVEINDSYLDSAVRGLWARSAGTGIITRCTAKGSWFGGHTQQGVIIQRLSSGAVDGFIFENCKGVLNDAGLVTSGAVKNVHVRGGSFAQNVGAGLSIGDNASHITLAPDVCGAGDGLLGNGTGIIIGANVDYYLVDPGSFTGNTTQMTNGSPAAANGRVRSGKGFDVVKRGSIAFSASTTVVVSHGLPVQPNDYDIIVRPGVGLAAGANPRVTATTSTTFTVTIDSASSGFIHWEAKHPLFRG